MRVGGGGNELLEFCTWELAGSAVRVEPQRARKDDDAREHGCWAWLKRRKMVWCFLLGQF